MKVRKVFDFLVNVVVPLVTGSCIYYFANFISVPVVRNHLADGLWAYAFLSSILIVWNREVHLGWIIVIVILSIVFETLQYLHIIRGTGDWTDVITYLCFFALGLTVNPYFAALIKNNL